MDKQFSTWLKLKENRNQSDIFIDAIFQHYPNTREVGIYADWLEDYGNNPTMAEILRQCLSPEKPTPQDVMQRLNLGYWAFPENFSKYPFMLIFTYQGASNSYHIYMLESVHVLGKYTAPPHSWHRSSSFPAFNRQLKTIDSRSVQPEEPSILDKQSMLIKMLIS